MNIDQLIQNFKSFDELKVFTEGQFKQIIQLQKRIKDLEEQAVNLKKEQKELVKKEAINSPILLEAGNIKGQEDAKMIAQVQLKMLKELSFERELTLDEAKRVDLFNKILIEKPEKEEKPLKADAKVVKSEDLFKLIKDGTE